MNQVHALLIVLLTTLATAIPTAHAALYALKHDGFDEIKKRMKPEELSEGLRSGFDHAKKGNYKDAYRDFTKAAEQGDANAHILLGIMHRRGLGTPKNLRLAKESYQKAADLGKHYAEAELVLLRFASPGSPEEFTAARTQLEKLASEGMAVAQLRLGLAYLTGYGYKADAAKALDYLTRAAKSNSRFSHEAEISLGELYLNGNAPLKIKPDLQLAESWITKAAEAGHKRAMRALGEFYLNSHTDKQDYAQARSWFNRLHKLGDPYGTYYLGETCQNGLGVKKSLEAAAVYYRQAAEKKVPAAIFRLATFYEHGFGGVKKDPSKSLTLYREGSQLGHSICMYNLAVMLEGKDNDPEKHKAEVMRLLLQAAAQGLVQAQLDIGLRYQQGRGVRQDFVASAAWLDRAAQSGNAEAQFRLGRMYASGSGVKPDPASARRLYELAARQGYLNGLLHYAEALANGVGGEQNLPGAYVFATKAIALAPPNSDAHKAAVKLRDALEKLMTFEQLEKAIIHSKKK